MSLEIVLYDSSPVTQKIFSHILYHYAPTVYRTDKVSELLNKIQYSKPDIIFMDYPSSQALEQNTLKNINTKTRSQNIPIILMTSNDSTPKDQQSSLAKDFLSKPIEATKLTELVHRFVPKTKTNILSQHLQFQQFPSTKQNDMNLQKTEQPATTKQSPLVEQPKKELSIDVEQVSQDEVASFMSTHQTASHVEKLSVTQELDKAPKTINVNLEETKLAQAQGAVSSSEKKPSQLESDQEDILPLDTAVVEDTHSNADQDKQEKEKTNIDVPLPTTPDQTKNDNTPTIELFTKPQKEKKSSDKAQTTDNKKKDSTEFTTMVESPQTFSQASNINSSPIHSIKPLASNPSYSENKEHSETQEKTTQNKPSTEQLEEAIKVEIETQVKKFINKNMKTSLKNSIQDIIPKLAKEIIKEELQKLLNENEN